MASDVYFAQFTDVHICTAKTAEAANAERFLSGALEEVASLNPHVECIMITGDIGSTETDPELRIYKELINNAKTPIYAVPSGNHDAWRSDEPWLKWMGQHRYCIDLAELRLILLGEFELGNAPSWERHVHPEEMEWIRQRLKEADGRPIVMGFHSPLLQQGSGYAYPWVDANTPKFLQMLSEYNVLAVVTGHWHMNAEWQVNPGNLRLINTGALCGWQWNGVPPQPRFGLRPGYRLFRYSNGELETFWRDLGTSSQISLTDFDGKNTGGPRPQARAMEIGRPAKLHVQTMSLKHEVQHVEWALGQVERVDAVGRVSWKIQSPGWQPLEQKSTHLWGEWESTCDPEQLPAGDGMLVVRASDDKTVLAYDAIPVQINRDGDVRVGALGLFLTWSLPK